MTSLSADAPRVDDALARARELPIDQAELRATVEHLAALGSAPSGFRVTGTPEDRAAAARLAAAEMRAIGLQDVSVETVPVYGWRMRSASLEVGRARLRVRLDGRRAGRRRPASPRRWCWPATRPGAGSTGSMWAAGSRWSSGGALDLAFRPGPGVGRPRCDRRGRALPAGWAAQPEPACAGRVQLAVVCGCAADGDDPQGGCRRVRTLMTAATATRS